MKDPYNKMGQMMRTPPAVLMSLEQKMNSLTGQEGVLEDILRANDITVDQTLAGLGLTRRDRPGAVRKALIERLGHQDQRLYELLGKPDLSVMSEACKRLCETAFRVYTPPPGYFLKKDAAIGMLEKFPPHNLLEHFGYANIPELIAKEGFAPVMASLRFTQTQQWMHEFFDIAYSNLGMDDFEERPVELIILRHPHQNRHAGRDPASVHPAAALPA
jgi:hypothetical protein